MTHAPTPWKMRLDGPSRPTIESDEEGCFIDGFMGSDSERQANAAYIVHAVNSHDEMINLLKESLCLLRYEFEGTGGKDLTGVDMFKRIEKAIAKSEGK